MVKCQKATFVANLLTRRPEASGPLQLQSQRKTDRPSRAPQQSPLRLLIAGPSRGRTDRLPSARRIGYPNRRSSDMDRAERSRICSSWTGTVASSVLILFESRNGHTGRHAVRARENFCFFRGAAEVAGLAEASSVVTGSPDSLGPEGS